jgi:hypothetical protein
MFPDGRTADDDYRGLVDFNRGLEEPGLLALEDEIRAHVRENSLAAQAERAGQEAGRQGRAFRDNIGPWAKSLPGRVGEFVVDEGKRLGGTIGGIIDNEIDPMSDEAIQAVFETTGLLALQAPLTGAKGAAGVFGGRLAKTADLDALSRAERMAASGADRRAIWDETGWFKGRDGQWRFEIDDSGANFPRMPTELQLKNRDNIGQSFKHPDLYEAYPEMELGRLQPHYGSSAQGSYAANPDRITLNASNPIGTKNKPLARSVTLHELQHGVQNQEGFARGGNLATAASDPNLRPIVRAEADALRAARSQRVPEYDFFLREILDEADSPAARQRYDAYVRELTGDVTGDEYDAIGRKLYNRLAGEVEARNVQTRRDFTPEQRRAQAPWETQDVPDDLQIVRMGGDGPQMATAKPRTFWRGENPGDTRRISTGNETWDSHLFVSSDPKQAEMYGRQLTQFEAAPDAKILYEGTAEWRKVAGAWRKNENLLEYANRAAEAAKAAGYDAAHFKMQGNVGTAVFNRDKFKPVGN